MTDKINMDLAVNGGLTYDGETGYYAVGVISEDGNRVSGIDIDRGAVNISIGNTQSADSFDRLRVSQPNALFENKNIHQKHESLWQEKTNGVGASITWNKNESSVKLAVGTVSGEYAIRQADRYNAYFPARSQVIHMTGFMATGKTNLVQRIGYFDDLNGIFFEMSGTTKKVVLRSSVSGSVVDTAVEQDSWNIDKFDGTGDSGITIDFTKSQIYNIDFQWLGVGRIRFGFNINGQLKTCHEVYNSNTISVPYMQTPTLPVRYEIRNIGTTASSSTLTEMCSSVAMEGGEIQRGLEFAKGNGATLRTNITVKEPIFAIRLKDAVLAAPNDKPNRTLVQLISAEFWAEDKNTYFEVYHIHEPTALTATWTSVDPSSAVEYSRDITAITGTHEHELVPKYVPAGVGGAGSSGGILATGLLSHSFIQQNYDSTNSDCFVIYATSMPGTAAKAAANLLWREYE